MTIAETRGAESSASQIPSTTQPPPLPILPLALRNNEITESDFETLLKIAEDKNATAGRLRSLDAIPGIKQAVESR